MGMPQAPSEAELKAASRQSNAVVQQFLIIIGVLAIGASMHVPVRLQLTLFQYLTSSIDISRNLFTTK